MKVFGNPASTCTRKVLTLLQEKGAKYDFQIIDFMKGEHKQEPHLSRQPFGQVPAIDHDGFSLYESRAIIRYLDEVLPGPRLTPADPRGRAVMEQWISVETSNFTPPAMKIIYQLLFNKMAGKEPVQSAIDDGRKGTARTVEIMARQLAKSPYLAGENFTLADICYLPYIEYLFVCDQGDLITSDKHVGAWWNRCSERPSWQIASGKKSA